MMNALDVGMIDLARNAHMQLAEIEKSAIERARLILELRGEPVHNFRNEDGYTVRLVWSSFFNTNLSTDVNFASRDEQSGYPEKIHNISREMLFNDTEEIRDFNELKRLQKKLNR